MFTHGARAQPPGGVEEHEVHHKHQDQRGVGDGGIVEKHRAQQGNLGQRPQGDGLQLPFGAQAYLIEVARQPQGQDIDHRAADDLVNLEGDGHEGQQQAHHRADGHPGQHGQEQIAGPHIDQKAQEGGQEHLALNADVDHPRSLAHQAAHGAQHQGHRLAQGRGQHRLGHARVAGVGPRHGHQQQHPEAQPQAPLAPKASLVHKSSVAHAATSV